MFVSLSLVCASIWAFFVFSSVRFGSSVPACYWKRNDNFSFERFTRHINHMWTCIVLSMNEFRMNDVFVKRRPLVEDRAHNRQSAPHQWKCSANRRAIEPATEKKSKHNTICGCRSRLCTWRLMYTTHADTRKYIRQFTSSSSSYSQTIDAWNVPTMWRSTLYIHLIKGRENKPIILIKQKKKYLTVAASEWCRCIRAMELAEIMTEQICVG